MKATLISKENNEAKFTIEITAEEFENAVIDVYKSQKDKFVIDGFRKGKAPRSIIEKKYGETIFFEDAINKLFSLHYPLALDELDLDVIDNPKADFSELKKGEGFTITIEVACYPEIEVKDYKGVEIEAVKSEVTDEDVENEIKSMARKNSRMVTVDRPAQDGDMVLIDYEGWVGDEQFEGGTAERQPLKLGSGTFIPGFEEQLIGVSTGESKDVKVTFPEEYHAADLAGKEAVFKCKVHEIKEEELPEINDEFVKDVSETANTVDEYKKEIREKLEKQAEERADAAFESEIIETISDNAKIDIPKAMVEEQIDAMLRDMELRMMYQGLRMQDFLKYSGQTMEQLRDTYRQQAEDRVKTQLTLEAITKAEGIEPTDEEIDKELSRFAEQGKKTLEEFKKDMPEGDLAYFKEVATINKTVKFLKDNAGKE